MLSPQYTSEMDAAGGPLRPGHVGEVVAVDASDQPIHVAYNGARWWYTRGALVPADTADASPTVPSSLAVALAPAIITTGSQVQLSHDYTDFSDATQGPLRPGDVGVVVTDDRSSKPFEVRAACGRKWWYEAGALVAAGSTPALVPPPVSSSPPVLSRSLRAALGSLPDLAPSPLVSPRGSSSSLTGQCFHAQHEHPLAESQARVGWTCDVCRAGSPPGRYRCTAGCDWDACATCMARNGHHSEFRGPQKRQWCSLAMSADGPLCAHEGGIISSEHWACCGRTLGEQGCFAAPQRPPRVAVDQGLRLNRGDAVMLSHSYRTCEDAARGPLQAGEVGHIVGTDSSMKPYRVQAPSGATWWYTREALDPASAHPPQQANVVTMANLVVGRRVRRGPDWRWGDQDQSSVGELLGSDSPGWARVRWAVGSTVNSYRVSGPGQYDLVFVDGDAEPLGGSETFALPGHPHRVRAATKAHCQCDICGQDLPRQGHFRCVTGCDWDVCGVCLAATAHSGEFRGPERHQWCSLASDEDGLLCTHGDAQTRGQTTAIVSHPHWSCCASEGPDAPGCSRAAVPPAPLRGGDLVVLAPDYLVHQDSGSGPLRLGDIGVVMNVDVSSKPLHVMALRTRKMWWYATAALRAHTLQEIAAPPGPPPPPEHARCTMCYERDATCVNLPCAHVFLCMPCTTEFRRAQGDICISCREPSTVLEARNAHACQMCLEERPFAALFSVRGCGHTFCKLCFVQFLKGALGDVSSQFPLRCPLHSEGCTTLVPYRALKCLLGFRATTDEGRKVMYTDADNKRLEHAAIEAAIPPAERAYCANGSCARALRKVPGVTRLPCEFCGHVMCGSCWGGEHPRLSCQMARLQREGKDEETKQLIKKTSKACPKCSMAITHYRGHACHHIRPGTGCPGCSTHFCFSCLRPHNSPDCHCERFCSPACDCQDCPDCHEGRPCPHCDNDGRCRVCRPPRS